eukprot:Blabericola_migrator_1__11741@NODE_70_length_15323_cov_105_367593_g63_i0_p4_GENE_NODE_70_length_15323_cov_105_367593_g63_i0NODE_70_length_15323_cov_105_367593_g63_i0_p4_ORF_typecomplete_len565_score88_05_NODE_70_length_15323_cov_105_367593_g63_i01146013154
MICTPLIQSSMHHILALSGISPSWSRALQSSEEFVRLAERSPYMPGSAYAVELLDFARFRHKQTKAEHLPETEEDPYAVWINGIQSRDIQKSGQPGFLPAMAWLATVLLEEHYGNLNSQTLAGLMLCAETLIASGLVGMATVERSHQEFKRQWAHMQSPSYIPRLTPELRMTYRDMLRVWLDPRRKRRFQVAAQCLEKAFIRLAAKVAATDLREVVYYQQEIDRSPEAELPSPEVWSVPIPVSHEDSFESVSRQLVNAMEKMLVALTLGVSHRIEMAFVQQLVSSFTEDASRSAVSIKQQGKLTGEHKVYGPTTASHGTGKENMQRSLTGHNVITDHEMFHRFRLELSSWYLCDTQHFYGSLLQALSWCVPTLVKRTERCPDMPSSLDEVCLFLVHPRSDEMMKKGPLPCRSPAEWFKMEVLNKAIHWVYAQSTYVEALSYPVPLEDWSSGHARKTLTVLTKWTHCTSDMQAKWLFHYLASTREAAALMEEPKVSQDSASLAYEAYTNPFLKETTTPPPPSVITLRRPKWWESPYIGGTATEDSACTESIFPVCGRPVQNLRSL